MRSFKSTTNFRFVHAIYRNDQNFEIRYYIILFAVCNLAVFQRKKSAMLEQHGIVFLLASRLQPLWIYSIIITA